MPDWSYRTILRPVLFGLGPERARVLGIGALARLGRWPGGLALIDFLGHMRPDPRVETVLGGVRFPGPVGLEALTDPGGRASRALRRFGGGFLEVGPITGHAGGREVRWAVDFQANTLVAEGGTCAEEEVERRIAGAEVGPKLPVFLRLADGDAVTVAGIAGRLAATGRVTGFVVCGKAADVGETLRAVTEVVRGAPERPLVLWRIGTGEDPRIVARIVGGSGADGVWLASGETCPTGGVLHGAVRRTAVREAIAPLRASLGPGAILVAGGVLEPGDARDFLDQGASLAAVDAGLVLGGPGLLKRCHEALAAASAPGETPEPLSLEAARHDWPWFLALGLAMLLGGGLAALLACTRVVLPYDEALCGIPRGKLAEINPRLLPFMAHDRMTLAGTMLSIGILYATLAWNAIRRGAHWAKVAVVVSAVSGFLTFFLFLGFGYFDPFHAFVTAVLFQFNLLGVHAPLPPKLPPAVAEWRESPAWRRGQWGQLLFVLLGVGLFGAGVVIGTVGCTTVFVGTDLEFLRTTAAELLVAGERLVPLIAHDRASLGGMLMANGLVVWLAAQWGFRAGEAWLWHALFWAGHVAFGCAVGVHLAVGYTHWIHLAPALAGWALWSVALALCREWLCLRPENGGVNGPPGRRLPRS